MQDIANMQYSQIDSNFGVFARSAVHSDGSSEFLNSDVPMFIQSIPIQHYMSVLLLFGTAVTK